MRENGEILFDASGHLSDETIALYGEALVYRKEIQLPNPVLDHVEECTSCKQKIINTCDILREKEEGKRVEIKKQIFSGRFILRIAAAILILCGTSVAVLIVMDKNSEKNQGSEIAVDSSQNDRIIDVEIVGKDHIKDTIVRENNILLAQNYTESELLENLSETVFRSDMNLEILSPEYNESFDTGQKISFSWKADQDVAYTIRLYNNRDVEPIYEFKNLDVKLLFSEKLEKGLYYWKLETEDDLLFVGKFMIK